MGLFLQKYNTCVQICLYGISFANRVSKTDFTSDSTQTNPHYLVYPSVLATRTLALHNFTSSHIPITYIFLKVVLFQYIKIRYKKHLNNIMAFHGFKIELHLLSLTRNCTFGKTILNFKISLS